MEILTSLLYRKIADTVDLENQLELWNDEENYYDITNTACYAMLGVPEESMVSDDDIEANPAQLNKEDFSNEYFFGERAEITFSEYAKLQYLYAMYFIETGNLTLLEALYLYNEDMLSCYEDEYGDIAMLVSFLLATRISMLRLHLQGKGK